MFDMIHILPCLTRTRGTFVQICPRSTMQGGVGNGYLQAAVVFGVGAMSLNSHLQILLMSAEQSQARVI